MADNDDMDLEELPGAGENAAAEGDAPAPEPVAADLAAGELGEGDAEGGDPVLEGEGEEEAQSRSATDLAAVYDIPVNVSAVLGKSTMQVSSLLKLGRGAVLELDRKVGEAIDIYVNNRLVARGEVVVVEDRLGVTMTEIIKSDNG